MADDLDFGFTAVDEDELGGLVPQPHAPSTVVQSVDLAPVTAKLAELQTALAALKPATASHLSRVEEKMDRVLNMELHELNATLQSQGHSLDTVLQEVEQRVNATRDECKAKLQEAERLILPLLQNLLKNPEKKYILWENRAERISTQIDRITAVTRSMGV